MRIGGVSYVIRPDYRQRFLLPPDLDDWVSRDHPVRFVRDFVLSLDLDELSFKQPSGDEGRPAYAAELLLSIWLFGWMERVRSSRSLEKACRRDVAFLWLTGNLHPDHNTIWRFFKDNRSALRKLFKKVVQVAVKAGLVGFALHALDGTKIAAASSMDTTLHRKNLEKKLKKIDALIEKQLKEVEAAQAAENESYAMPEAMQNVEERRKKIQESLRQLDEHDTNHVHPRETEARVMKTRTHRTLGYNAQAVVDEKSDLIVAVDVVSDQADSNLLTAMLSTTEETAGRIADETVADKGYHNGTEIARAETRNQPVIVAIPDEAEVKGEYRKSRFRYDCEQDGYVCPRGELLTLQGRTTPTKKRPQLLMIYRCYNRDCPERGQCTKDAKGRTIKRSPFDDAVARQREKQAAPEKQDLLRRRKAIVEHIFGIQKQHDGFRRFTMRGREKALTQYALLASAMNLRKLLPHWLAGELVWG